MAITNKQLIRYARGQLGRMYTYGCYGQIGSEAVYISKLKQYPQKIGKWPKSSYTAGYGEKWHDCAGLLKGAIFCQGNPEGKPVYNCNYDYSADGIIKLCEEKGEVWPIDKMPKNITGLVVWKPGHLGIWDADTQTVIEAAGHARGVCETTSTPWQKAGKLPASWVIYDESPAPAPAPEPGEDKIMLTVDTLKKGSKGPEVFAVQSILKAKGYKDKDGHVLATDSSFGAKTEAALKKYQAANGLTVDGIAGAKTWNSLINK